MPDVFRVGSQLYSWNSSSTRIDGQPWQGAVALNYGQKLEVDTVYSQTQDGVPVGGTGGQYSTEGVKIRFLIDSYDAVTDYVSGKGPFNGYGRNEFALQVSVTEPLIVTAKPIIFIAPVCRIIGETQVIEKGIDTLVVEASLWVPSYSVNGKTMYTQAVPGVL